MKIEFHYQHDFEIEDEAGYGSWIERAVGERNFLLGTLTYVFMSDDELLEMNRKYLNHDTFTDIITFDYSEGNTISGDIFISSDRVKENAERYGVNEASEMRRVMAHGALHLMGYKDKTEEEKRLMREEENRFMEMFHVEQ